MNPSLQLAALLKTHRVKVVFAESCTAGLASATLARVPGVSEFHCGGMVVYRNATKRQYLDIPANLLETVGPVSEPVAREMALRILQQTPEADYAAAVTGHLGPNAPPEQDGQVFIAVARRQQEVSQTRVWELRCAPGDSRVVRQRKMAAEVLQRLSETIAADYGGNSTTGKLA